MAPSDEPEAPELEPFEDFLDEFDRLMASEPVAALRFIDEADDWIRAEGQWVLCRAEALSAVQGAGAAAEYLSQVVNDEPEFADAHYCLAELYHDLGQKREAITHHLATLRLDCMLDRVSEPPAPELEEGIRAEAGRVLASLPSPFQEKVAHVPVFLLPRPSEELVADGFDSRALGLFEGPNLSEGLAAESAGDSPTVTLFTHCLMDAFGEDEQELKEQVRVTVLHELGHYFCLDEEQLARLGLD
jgi:predicted Zn-dependent protease with MMP-like domain